MRSPLTAMVFTLELTHDLNLLPGLLIGSLAAHAVTVLLLPRSILTEKVARRGYHISREYSVDPLTAVRVGEVMDRDVPTILSSMKVKELSAKIADHDPRLTQRQGIPILDEAENLAGMITRGDVLRALENRENEELTVLEAGSAELVVAYPDELLKEAVNKMLRNNIGRLPVVERGNTQKLIGYLGRAGVMAAQLKQHEEENVREAGLLGKAMAG